MLAYGTWPRPQLYVGADYIDWASPVNRDEYFYPDSGVNRTYYVLYPFDYMASGLARLAEIPSAAYQASPEKTGWKLCILLI